MNGNSMYNRHIRICKNMQAITLTIIDALDNLILEMLEMVVIKGDYK